MNKQKKDQEQQYKYLKFDCEMRAKSIEIASKLSTNNSVASLLKDAGKIAKYIFGLAEQPKEDK
jgi:hypothetical protein